MVYVNNVDTHLSVCIELHDNPNGVHLNDPNELNNVRVIQVLHQTWNQGSNTTRINRLAVTIKGQAYLSLFNRYFTRNNPMEFRISFARGS